MTERDRPYTPPILGGATLLTVLAVLCLTLFALICLSAARTGQAESVAGAQEVEEYYAADCRAQELLARLRQGELPEGVTFGENGLRSYTIPVGETRELQVEVEVQGADSYTVRSWRTVSTER